MSLVPILRNSALNKNQSQEDFRLKFEKTLKFLESNKKKDIHDLEVGKDFLKKIFFNGSTHGIGSSQARDQI